MAQNRQMEEKVIIRMPDGMREQIKSIAANNRRSMNSEILTILERAVKLQSPEMQNGSVTA